MFRRGGSTNTGIMSGLVDRTNYENGAFGSMTPSQIKSNIDMLLGLQDQFAPVAKTRLPIGEVGFALASGAPVIDALGLGYRKFVSEEVEAGRLKRPIQFQTQAADPTLPTDRYNIVRATTSRDFKQYGAPKGSKYKISFKKAKTPETTRIPTEYQGTQYYKSKSQADGALKGYKKFSKDLKKAGKAGRSLRDIILRDIYDLNVE